MKKKIFTSLGLMSGTSMDGVDLSVIKSDGYDEFTSIFNTYREFDKDLYKELISIRNKISDAKDLKIYSNDLINKNTHYFIVPNSRSLDIDTPEDFKIVKSLLS